MSLLPRPQMPGLGNRPTMPTLGGSRRTEPVSQQPDYGYSKPIHEMYPVGSEISEDQLNQLLQSKGLIDYEQYSDRKNMFAEPPNFFGAINIFSRPQKDFALFRDPSNPSGKGGSEFEFSPIYESRTMDDFLRESAGVGKDVALIPSYSEDGTTTYRYYDPTTKALKQIAAPSTEGWFEEMQSSGDNPEVGTGNYSRSTGKYKVWSDPTDDVEKHLQHMVEKDQDDEGGFLGDILGPIASIAAAIPGPWQIPAAFISAANSFDRGDPLGGILSFAGAAVPGMSGKIGGAFGITDPSMARAVGSAVTGGLRGIKSGNVLEGAVMGGLGSYGGDALRGVLPSDLGWLATPLVRGGLSLASGKPMDFKQLAMMGLPGYINQQRGTEDYASAPRQATIKGVK